MTMPTRTPTARSTRTDVERRKQPAAVCQAARAAERRRRRLSVAFVVLLALLVAGGIAVQASRSTSGAQTGAPAGLTADGIGVPLGARGAPVLVELYEDFLCPACRRFEETAGTELREMAAAGQVRIVYRGMAFLDGASTSRYSTRALNAAACAVDAGRFPQYHDRLFAAQPPEGGAGLSDARLVALGAEAGISGGDFAGCVEDLRYERWTQRATDAASKAGVVQTPTVRVNGHDLPAPTLEELRAAVNGAQH
jgi:protein-disulfide isomerase